MFTLTPSEKYQMRVMSFHGFGGGIWKVGKQDGRQKSSINRWGKKLLRLLFFEGYHLV